MDKEPFLDWSQFKRRLVDRFAQAQSRFLPKMMLKKESILAIEQKAESRCDIESIASLEITVSTEEHVLHEATSSNVAIDDVPQLPAKTSAPCVEMESTESILVEVTNSNLATDGVPKPQNKISQSQFGIIFEVVQIDLGVAVWMLQKVERLHVLDVLEVDEFSEKSTCVNSTLIASHVLDRMLLKGQKLQHTRRLKKCSKTWKFKFKISSWTRCLVHKKLWFSETIKDDVNTKDIVEELAISEILEKQFYFMGRQVDLEWGDQVLTHIDALLRKSVCQMLVARSLKRIQLPEHIKTKITMNWGFKFEVGHVHHEIFSVWLIHKLKSFQQTIITTMCRIPRTKVLTHVKFSSGEEPREEAKETRYFRHFTFEFVLQEHDVFLILVRVVGMRCVFGIMLWPLASRKRMHTVIPSTYLKTLAKAQDVIVKSSMEVQSTTEQIHEEVVRTYWLLFHVQFQLEGVTNIIQKTYLKSNLEIEYTIYRYGLVHQYMETSNDTKRALATGWAFGKEFSTVWHRRRRKDN